MTDPHTPEQIARQWLPDLECDCIGCRVQHEQKRQQLAEQIRAYAATRAPASEALSPEQIAYLKAQHPRDRAELEAQIKAYAASQVALEQERCAQLANTDADLLGALADDIERGLCDDEFAPFLNHETRDAMPDVLRRVAAQIRQGGTV